MDPTLKLAGGNKDAQQWAASEARLLNDFISGGTDNWADLEAELLQAQEDMTQQIDGSSQGSGSEENNQAGGTAKRTQGNSVSLLPNSPEVTRTRAASTASIEEFRDHQRNAASWKNRFQNYNPQAEQQQQTQPHDNRSNGSSGSGDPDSGKPHVEMIDDDGVGPLDAYSPRSNDGASKDKTDKISSDMLKDVAVRARTMTMQLVEQNVPAAITEEDDAASEMLTARSRTRSRSRTHSMGGAASVTPAAEQAGQPLSLENAVRAYREKIADLQDQVQALQAEMTLEAQQVLFLQEQESISQAEIENIRSSLDQQSELLMERESQVATLNATLQKAQSLLKERESAFAVREATLLKEQQEISQRFQTLDQEKSSLKSEIARFVEDSSQLKSQLHQKSLELQSVSAKLSVLEREREFLEKQKDNLKQDSSKQSDFVDSLRGQLESSLKELNDARSENMLTLERLAVLKREKEALLMSAESLTRSSQQHDLAGDVRLQDVQTEIREKERQLREQKAADEVKLNMIQMMLTQETERYRALELSSQREIQEIKANLQEQNDGLKHRINAFKQQILELSGEKKLFESKVSDIMAEKLTLEAEASSQLKKIKHMQQKMDVMENQLTDLQREAAELRKQKSLQQHELETVERTKQELLMSFKKAEDERKQAVEEKHQLLEMLSRYQEGVSTTSTDPSLNINYVVTPEGNASTTLNNSTLHNQYNNTTASTNYLNNNTTDSSAYPLNSTGSRLIPINSTSTKQGEPDVPPRASGCCSGDRNCQVAACNLM